MGKRRVGVRNFFVAAGLLVATHISVAFAGQSAPVFYPGTKALLSKIIFCNDGSAPILFDLWESAHSDFKVGDRRDWTVTAAKVPRMSDLLVGAPSLRDKVLYKIAQSVEESSDVSRPCHFEEFILVDKSVRPVNKHLGPDENHVNGIYFTKIDIPHRSKLGATVSVEIDDPTPIAAEQVTGLDARYATALALTTVFGENISDWKVRFLSAAIQSEKASKYEAADWEKVISHLIGPSILADEK
jgi:hypothetical protein